MFIVQDALISTAFSSIVFEGIMTEKVKKLFNLCKLLSDFHKKKRAVRRMGRNGSLENVHLEMTFI